MQFKPYRKSKKSVQVDMAKGAITADIARKLNEIGIFVHWTPEGQISFRDKNDQLWEITVQKSDVKRAFGE